MTTLAAGLLLSLAIPCESQEAPARARQEAQKDLDQALQELSRLRTLIEGERLPLVKKARALEDELVAARREHEDVSRKLDAQSLGIGNLKTEVEALRQERSYLESLLGEYSRNFPSRLHVSELHRYRDTVDAAQQALEDPDLGAMGVFRAQAALVDRSVSRAESVLGGDRFRTEGVDEQGRVRQVEVSLVGPFALYLHESSGQAGTIEERMGSLEPNLIPLPQENLRQAAAAVVAEGRGTLPMDPTLGNARRIAATKDTLWEHVQKGGLVMVPILVLAASALLVALLKLIQLARIPQPSEKRVRGLLEALHRGDHEEVTAQAEGLKGPAGEMVRAGTAHLEEPKQLIEEVMYETMLATRLRLQGWLPFIAVCAAAAPLLGLLGTVTGIINTFKLITVFGTGDAQTLSSGISEALITTEFGLIVAIPSLLLHAWLHRKAKRLTDRMEKTAVAFLNRIAGPPQKKVAAPPRREEIPLRGEAPTQAATAEISPA